MNAVIPKKRRDGKSSFEDLVSYVSVRDHMTDEELDLSSSSQAEQPHRSRFSRLVDYCVFRSIRSRIGIEVRSAIRIHSINRELNFFYRFLTRFCAAFHYRGIFPQ